MDNWDCIKEVTGESETTYLVPEGQILSFIRGGVTYQAHSDHVGSVRMITDEEGDVVARYEYSGFGAAISVTEDPALTDFPARFIGSLGVRFDDINGLLYMRNRWYCPTLGRFISRDPIGLEGDFNAYLYASNNPLRKIDPSGLQPPELVQDLRYGQKHTQLPCQAGGRLVVLLYASPAAFLAMPGGATFATTMSEGHHLVVALGILANQHGQEFLDLASGSPVPTTGPISFSQAERLVAKSRLNMVGVELVESECKDACGFVQRVLVQGLVDLERTERGNIKLFLTKLGQENSRQTIKTTAHELFHIRSQQIEGYIGSEANASTVEYYVNVLDRLGLIRR